MPNFKVSIIFEMGAVVILSLSSFRKFMKDQVKICFGLLKILVRYLIN